MDTRAEIQLTDFDTLFSGGSAEMEKALFTCGHGDHKLNVPVIEIDIESIKPFPGHPFKVRDDEEMNQLIENIKEYGVLHPVLVRRLNNGTYEMISGHRRKYASVRAGKVTIPARVLELTDDEATILMADANFLQRTFISLSEKAHAYRMKFDAIKHQGQRGEGSSYSEMGNISGESRKTIQRLIRLSYLIDELLEMVDAKKLGVVQGVDISYLSDDDQRLVLWGLNETGVKLSINQSSMIKKLASESDLTKESLLYILAEQEVKEVFRFTMNERQLNEFFTNAEDIQEIERIILALLVKWKEGKINV